MIAKFRAVYRNGAFVPQRKCDIPEGTEVELTVEEPSILPPTVTDPEERQRVIERLLKRMDENPIPAAAPRFTRDELHERR